MCSAGSNACAGTASDVVLSSKESWPDRFDGLRPSNRSGRKFIPGFDQPLAEGRFPASRWQPGDMGVGDWSVTLPSQLESGIHEVWIRMYGPDGVRSEVYDTDQEVLHNRVLLGMVET